MCEPISLGAVFASIGSAFKFADFAVRIAEVGSENEVFVRTIAIVREDLREVERLLYVESVQRKLTSIPGKLPWIRAAVLNTKRALNEIGRWVERARSEQQSTGEIRFETRVRWVFSDHERLVNRKTELVACHQQLSNVLSYINRLEDIPTISGPPDYIDTTFFDDLLARHRRPTGQRWPLPDLKGSHSTSDLSFIPITASNTSRSYTQPSDRAIDLDFVGSETPPLRTTTFPDSPPHSPPPTYNSIVQLSNSDDFVNHVESSSTSSTSRYSRFDKPTITYTTAMDQNPGKQSWAYIFPSREAGTAEAAGDDIIMSATNRLGPVNPFELSSAQLKDTTVGQSRQSNMQVLRELLGDLNFPVELPAGSNPGPPPGYPRRASDQSLSSRGSIQTGLQPHGRPHRQSLPELPVMPRRRPVPPHSRPQPQVSHHVDATMALIKPLHRTQPAEKMLAITEQNDKEVSNTEEDQVRAELALAARSKRRPQPPQSRDAFDRYRRRSTQPQPPSTSLPFKRASSPLPSSTHDQIRPAPSLSRPSSSQSLPIPVIASPHPAILTPPSRPSRPSRPSSAIGPAPSSTPPVPPKVFESASVARRHRQREMMDLLGSLDET